MAIKIESKRNCQCVYCKNQLPFELPQEIIDALINGELVIFAGAGISTESKTVFKDSFYEDVFYDIENAPSGLDFPSLMSLFCSTRPNGRQKLLQKIKYRFDYCQQFNELYRNASAFHNEISSIFYLDTIITTNWDDYFERECGAVAITIPEDFAFYNLPSRKVLKIHGSINNYGTIVATKEDYDRCYRNLNKGIIGGYLKTILATKVVLFVGFSFNDYDFKKIYSYLKKELKELIPHTYVVTIDESLKENNATVINTDGTFFMSVLRKHLEGERYLIPRENIMNVYYFQNELYKIHSKTSGRIIKERQANIIYCTMYQDGIKHALDFIIYHINTGLSFNPHKIFSSLESYENLRRENVKAKRYEDVAYIDGYMEGLKVILYDEKIAGEIPFYYLFGKGDVYKDEFDKAIKDKTIFHKQAEVYAHKKFSHALTSKEGLVYHHTPFL